MASTLRAHGPPPAIRALVDSGSHMCDPYGARALVSASHHANTEWLRTGLLRSYQVGAIRIRPHFSLIYPEC